MKIINYIKCKLGFHKPYKIHNLHVCQYCLCDLELYNGKYIKLRKSYHDIRNEQLNEYYDKVKYAFSPEVEYDDDLKQEDYDSLFKFRDDDKYDHLSVYERELFEKIFLVHFLEELEKAKIIKVLR